MIRPQHQSRRSVLIGAASLAALALAPGRVLAGKPTSYWLLNREAPWFEAPLLGGGVYDSAQHSGKFQIIYFWSLWCPDCIYDADYTNKLSEALADEPGVGFLGLHCGPERSGRWLSVEDYVEDQSIPYSVAFDPEFAISELFAIEWFPSYVLVDPAGRIVCWRTDLGRDGWVKFRDHVRQQLRAA